MQLKKIYGVLFLSCSLFSLQAQSNMIDGVVWVVGDNAILRSEVEEQRIVHNMKVRVYKVIRIVLFPNK